MFDLKRPCVNCPFRKGVGETFNLRADRLDQIFEAPAFQCHKTVIYDEDEDGESFTSPGEKPQQCAGLMAVLHRSNHHNQIMQVAERLGHLDPTTIDPAGEAYDSIESARAAHGVLDG